jgi:hypothetical protein
MAPASSGRRGRPPEFVDDGTPPGVRYGGARQRVGWLLRRSRLHLRQGRFARQRAFVQALQGLGVSADASRVSRWEKNELEPPPPVVAVYEQLLGLPDAALQATARGLHRALNPTGVAPPLYALPATESPAEAEARAARLVDLALDDDPTGGQWCELVERLGSAGMVIMHGDVADRLLYRLVSETGRGVGHAFVTRYEALRRLCGLPRFVPVALRQIDRIVHEPWSGVLVDVVALLAEVPGTEPTRLILDLARDPNPELQQAALWAVSARVDRGEVVGVHMRQLEQVVLTLAGSSPAEGVQRAVSDVIACMPPLSRRRLLAATASLPGHGGRRMAAEGGELVPERASARTAAHVAHRALQSLGATDHDDPMLTRIVREALSHASQERRHQASLLLMLSPFRQPVADAVLEHWSALTPELRIPAAGLLSYVAGDTHVDELDRRVAADGPDELVRRSWMARAHLSQPVDDPDVVQRLEKVSPEVAKTTLYALGMTGSPQLSEVREAALPESVLGRARWWLQSGPAIRV